MKINFTKQATANAKKAISVVVVTEDDAKKSTNKAVKAAKDSFGFVGKSSEAHLVSDGAKVVAVVGAGKKSDLNDVALQAIGARVFSFVNANKFEAANISFPAQDSTKSATNIAFGALLKAYRFNRYFENKLEGKEPKLTAINLVTKDSTKAEKEFKELEILAENVYLARDLVSEPANVLNPETYAELCRNLEQDGLEVQVLGEDEMYELGMNSLLAVGQGSMMESQLVILKWNGGKKGDAPLAFVGKGVTFDTGGISIKPSQNMEDMKTDMGGSAVVVSLLRNLAQRKAKVNAVGVVGLVENMPSGHAQRPGDVVTSMSGQTIEVINTDAEGRMVLADALHYTNTKFKPKFIVDLATLTGAIVVCLADIHAGLFANDDKLAKEIEDSGKATGETVWRLPIGEEYDVMINSDIADMKNVGAGRGAGSTTAAQFLKRFIGKTKWAHLDIAGVAWKGKGDATAVKGATGYGVRLLNELVKKYEK